MWTCFDEVSVGSIGEMSSLSVFEKIKEAKERIWIQDDMLELFDVDSLFEVLALKKEKKLDVRVILKTTRNCDLIGDKMSPIRSQVRLTLGQKCTTIFFVFS